MTWVNNKKWGLIGALAVVSVVLAGDAFAVSQVDIGPDEATIKSSIKYSVIGRYNAVFDDYSGRIDLDWDNKEIHGVQLNIDAATIRSQCGWCDNIVRSKELLHVEKYPSITFQSNAITKTENGYDVTGELDFHGVIKEMTFPFQVNDMPGSTTDRAIINAKGQWTFNRKDFQLVWSRLLDKGGVLVGNDITVEWEVNLNAPQ